MPYDMQATPATTHVASCITCPVRGRCPAEERLCDDVARHGAAAPSIPLPHAGKTLYAAGTPAFAIYVVRAGCLKTVTHDADGNEHVRGFHFPGDLVGLDAVGSSSYPSSAIAVSPSQVCRLSKGRLQGMFSAQPEQLRRLLEHTSRELRDALAMSGNYTAEQRVAAFMLEMEERLAPAPGAGFALPMTRRDIANRLRLATETVCRVLGRFAEHGWMRGGARLKVLDREALCAVAAPVNPAHGLAAMAA